jgi:hypothetical protein
MRTIVTFLIRSHRSCQQMPIHYKLSIIFMDIVILILFPVDTQQQQQNITHTNFTLNGASRAYPAATSLGDLIFIGGGVNGTATIIELSDRVDIYNVTSGNWTTATLSVPRAGLVATSSGSLVFFAGGGNGSTWYNTVDIYNVSNGMWSVANLSEPRWFLAATSVADLVLFGGGTRIITNSTGQSVSVTLATVDMYNLSTNVWSVTNLSQARDDLIATSICNHIALFAGGSTAEYNRSNVVDIFDSWSGMWSVTTLSQARSSLAAASIGTIAFFGGGFINNNLSSNVVDIYIESNGTWLTATLSQARYSLAAAASADIVIFGGGMLTDSDFTSTVDILNITNNMWQQTNLSQARAHLTAATASSSSQNQIVFAFGNYTGGYSNVIDIFEIPLNNLSNVTTCTPQNSPSSSTAFGPPPSVIFFPSPSTFPVLSTPSFSYSPQALNYSPSLIEQTTNNNTNSQTVLLASLLSALAALIIAMIVVILVVRKKRKKKKSKKNQQGNENESRTKQRNGTTVLENDMSTIISSTETQTTVPSTYRLGTETLKSLTPGQIPLNELEIGTEIGNGNYGRVCVGKWKKYRVALKFCQNRGKMDEFMREVNLMISLPRHPNVVRMYGVSIDGTQPIIVMEYCAGGSLDKLLYDTEEQISDKLKIRWVHEIALGMTHLHKHNIVHRDLAARNILLTHANNLSEAHLKITDFGMSRVLHQGNEGITKNALGPIRWMAPESIGQQIYSKKSDVWMFGVLIYEIVARNEPHTDIDPNDVALFIRDHYLTPKIPNDCPHKLRQLMQMCWNKQPEQRPSFEEINIILEDSK